MQSWIRQHRLTLAATLLVSWVAYGALAVVDPERATALAVGAIPVTVALFAVARICFPGR